MKKNYIKWGIAIGLLPVFTIVSNTYAIPKNVVNDAVYEGTEAEVLASTKTADDAIARSALFNETGESTGTVITTSDTSTSDDTSSDDTSSDDSSSDDTSSDDSTSDDSTDSTTPTGEAPTGEAPSGTPPTGEAPSGTPPTGDSTSSDSSSSSVTLTGSTTVDGKTKTFKSKTLSSTTADENTVLVTNAGTATLKKCTLKKSGDTSSSDNSNFYGLNSVLCANLGSTITVKNTTIKSSSEGSNAIFSTGEGSTINVSDVTIKTTGNSSRGLDATYGGTIIADTVDITTTGAHCAALATDRGEGTVTVSNGTFSTAGDGSPCIYSTGTITATSCTGVATGSQAAVIEGKNSITLKKCTLTGAGSNGVMLYQSTSGDASVGTSVLTSTNSTIKTTSTGPMFYITNTDAEINLTNTKLTFSSGVLLNVAGNDTNNWGTVGSNGGNVTLTAKSQTLKGSVTCDNISTVTMNLGKKAKFTGCIDNENTGDVTISLAKTATWTLTKDSYVTAITDSLTDLSNITSAGYNIYYDSTNSANEWLDGATIELTGGGTLTPME